MSILYLFPLVVIAILLIIYARIYSSSISEILPENWRWQADNPKVKIAVFVILFIVFWGFTRDFFSGWLAASDGGKALGIEEESISTWLWLIPVVALLLSISYFTPYKAIANAGTIGLVVVSMGWIYQTQVENTGAVAAREIRALGGACTKPVEITNAERIIKAGDGKVFSICGDTDGSFYFYKPNGAYRLEIKFVDKFRRDNIEVLRTRRVTNFLGIKEPMTFAGSSANSWLITIKSAEFRNSGLSGGIKVHVKAVRR